MPPNPADEAFVRALVVAKEDGPFAPRGLERVFRVAYHVLAPAFAAASRAHGRAAVEDARQNVLREFLEKLRRGEIDPTRAPGLLRVMLWRRLTDERRRGSRLCLGVQDLDRVESRGGAS